MQKERVIEVIKDWIQIDNELRELQKISREKRQEKKELTNILVEIMRNNEIDCFDINNGKLIYSKRVSKSGITQKLLMETLSHFYKDDPEKADELSSYILNSRKEKVNETIRVQRKT